MSDDKSLPGGQEKIVRAVERVIAAASKTSQDSVRITNLASGKIQVEVHAAGDDLTETGDRARAEFERQTSLASVPTEELEHLRWLASIGQAAVEHGWKPEGNAIPESEPPDAQTEAALKERDDFLEHVNKRKSVYAEGDSDADLLSKLTEINMAGVEVSDV
jgi:hypothetical protein